MSIHPPWSTSLSHRLRSLPEQRGFGGNPQNAPEFLSVTKKYLKKNTKCPKKCKITKKKHKNYNTNTNTMEKQKKGYNFV